MSDRNYTFHPSVYQNWSTAVDTEIAGQLIEAGTPLIEIFPNGIAVEYLDGRIFLETIEFPKQ